MQSRTARERKDVYFVGIDLGGTNFKIGVLDNFGGIRSFLSVPTLAEKGPDDAMRRMSSAISKAIERAGVDREQILRVGLGSPGTQDLKKGTLVRPANLPGWSFYPIRDRLAGACGFPVTYANDASAAGYAEYWVGSGKNEPGLILLTLGTGVGCGLIFGGRSFDGVHDHGGECGHIIVDSSESARWCNCGQRGHLEAYASAIGVTRRTLEMVDSGLSSSLTDRLRSYRRQDEVPYIVYEEAKNGDELANRIIRETARWLSYGIVSLVHTLDPSCVLIGGAMTFGGSDDPIGEMFLETINQEVRCRLFKHLAERIHIKYASLGGDAGFIGAAGLARSAWLDEQDAEVEKMHNAFENGISRKG